MDQMPAHIENFYRNPSGGTLELSLCGYEECAADFFHHGGQIFQDSYLIHLIIKGSGWYRLGNTTYSLNPGDFFVIFQDDVVQYWHDTMNPWVFTWFAFKGTAAARYLDEMGLTRSNPIGHLDDPDQLQSRIADLIRISMPNTQAENELMIKGALYSALGYLYQQRCSREPRQPKRKQLYINQALAYIENNYNKPISIKDVANYISLDQGYFSKLFRSATGQSPARYLVEFRIHQACRLLRRTAIPASEIAQMVGYPNIYYFFRLFRQELGMTPGEYRATSRDATH